LSTVYGIVTQSGGSVRLVSAPGQGTTVWVYLPAAAAEAGVEPQVLLPRPATTAATILVVEDEALVRDLVRRALVRAGHTVHVAIDGTDALQQLAQGLAPNLLITDVVMPRLGGYDLVQQLGQRTPRLPVLFISGYTSEGEDLLQRTAGPTAVLHKPFTAGQLLATIAQLLARSDTAAASH
jgi:CheY-like chemotaxis protein